MKFLQISSLEKVFKDRAPSLTCEKLVCLKNETVNCQIAYFAETETKVRIECENPALEIRNVGFVPAKFLAYDISSDGNYCRTEAGLFPDVLYPSEDFSFTAASGEWGALYLSYHAGFFGAGDFEIPLRLIPENGETAVITIKIHVINARLPEQKMLVTDWFYVDCIAEVYNEPVFSASNWEHIKSFMKTAADNGINLLLTPIFTPELDTEVGKERLTNQLVGVTKTDGKYSFDFTRLGKWIYTAKSVGINNFEISHLFSQWGAAHTPKIIASVDGTKKRIFGWETGAASDEYRGFLAALLPELTAYLKKNGVLGHCYFHISDEPSREHIDNYNAAKAGVMPFLKNRTIMDALSDYELFSQGAVTTPVISIDNADYFISRGHKNPWVYYCCGQAKGCSNRHFVMPLLRTRAIGTQFFKFNAAGFLHWGYNFYHTQLSREVINPFEVTDAGEKFPAGDAFSVYPGKHGALESIRLAAFKEGLNDRYELELLAKLTSREETVKIMEEALGINVKFSNTPENPELYEKMRFRVLEEIEKNLS